MSPWRCFIQFSTKRLLLFHPQAVTQPQEDSGSLNTHYPKAQVERRHRTDIPAISDRFAGDWCEQFGPKMQTYFAPSAAIARNTLLSVPPSSTAVIATGSYKYKWDRKVLPNRGMGTISSLLRFPL